MRRAARYALAVGVAVAATFAGIGWLYLLRRSGLSGGPPVAEALPLQRLAGGASQPLARVVAAWLPAGILAGLALLLLGHERRASRAALVALPCLVVMLALGAAADAVTASEPLRAHLAEQPAREATWLAALLAVAGAALPGRLPVLRRAEPA